MVFVVVAAQWPAPGISAQGNELPYREAIGARWMLGQVANGAGKFPCACGAEGSAQQADVAGSVRDLASQNLEQCGFAGAVMPEQSGNLAFPEVDVDVPEDGGVADVHIQAGYFEERRHAGSNDSEGLQHNLNANYYQLCFVFLDSWARRYAWPVCTRHWAV